MRPPDLRHSSMARSSAQSECWELSTGTNTSRYTGTSRREGEQAVKLRKDLLWHQLSSVHVPDGDRIDRTSVARAQQLFSLDRFGVHEYHHVVFVQLETFGRRLHAVAEPHAQVAVDADPQSLDDLLLEATHIPSSPRSTRAVSITAVVISGMPRCRA